MERSRLPQKPIQIYPAARVEANAFALEKRALSRSARTRKADFAPRIYDALPRNLGARRQCVHGVAYQSRLSA
jgi:hypothetical protein